MVLTDGVDFVRLKERFWTLKIRMTIPNEIIEVYKGYLARVIILANLFKADLEDEK